MTKKLLIAVNGLLLVIAIALASQLWWPAGPSIVAAVAAPRTPAYRPAIDDAPSEEIFLATVNRPLFTADRQPAVPLTPVAGASGNPRLVGVVIARGRKLAVLADAGNSLRQVRMGDDIAGWKVVAIARNAVALDRNGERLELSLQGSTQPETPTVAADSVSTIPAVESYRD